MERKIKEAIELLKDNGYYITTIQETTSLVADVTASRPMPTG